MRLPALFAIVFAFLFLGCCGFSQTGATPYDLSVSSSPEQNVKVFFINKYGANITSSEAMEWIYPQQTGLAPGTRYSFRFVSSGGAVAVPLYEETVITADSSFPDFRISNFHSLPPDNYSVELVVIEGGKGRIAASSRILVYSEEQLKQEAKGYVMRSCSEFIGAEAAEYVPVRGPGENSTLYACVRRIALERNDAGICRLMLQLYAPNRSVFAVSDCIFDMALGTGNLSLCEQMPTTRQDVGLCRALIKNDWQECQRIQCDATCAIYSLDMQKDGCVKLYAIAKLDRAICDHIQGAGTRQSCLDFKYG
jgi:hypothetical protein